MPAYRKETKLLMLGIRHTNRSIRKTIRKTTIIACPEEVHKNDQGAGTTLYEERPRDGVV